MNTPASFPESFIFRRRTFVITFVALSVTFVPVLFYAGLFVSITPTVYLFTTLFGYWERVTFWMLFHIFVYVSLFTGAAFTVYRLASFLPWRGVRSAVLFIALLLPILCSFAHVLTYSSIQGGGGTYNFWEAIHRYTERHK